MALGNCNGVSRLLMCRRLSVADGTASAKGHGGKDTRMIVKISVALVGLVVLGLSVASARADVLNDELARLLASHPQILARKAEVAARAEGVQGSLSGYLPSITASGTVGGGGRGRHADICFL